MDSNRFSFGRSSEDLIYFKFMDEYNRCMNINNFTTFIANKDIGIKVINNHTSTYEITDKYKWLLAKIKYGF